MSKLEDYIDGVKASWFEFGRKAGKKEAEARIIELLDELIPAKPVYEMPMEYWVQRKLVEKAIALIKGETE